MRPNVAFLELLTGSPATVYNNANLGTTIVLFGAASSASPGVAIRLLQITNKATAAFVAFMPSSLASPSFVASGAGVVAATEGINVAPGASYFLNLKADVPLWLVASAASTPVQIVAYDKAVR